MNNLSSLVLVWLFGTWIFTAGELPANVAAEATQVTPLVIFASIFTTVGLAMFGLLGSWAIFLGIFRLRQNGNFFGARDGNESFFYPMRLVAAMALCAPVIPVASPGGVDIVLTPGHSMIAGITKSGSKWGDEAQSLSFRTMHRFNMFNEPNYKIDIPPSEARDMAKNWADAARAAAGHYFNNNPSGALASYQSSPNELASKMLEASWQRRYPDSGRAGYNTTAGAIDPFLTGLVTAVPLPPIPPTAAAAISLADENRIAQDYGGQTVDRESANEAALCGLMGTDMLCSDEYNNLRETNNQAIAAAMASAQRQVWEGIYFLAHQNALALRNGGYTAAQEQQVRAQYQTAVNDLAQWYSGHLSETIRNQLATNMVNQSELYFSQLDEWGWMMGGTFVLRAANDFSRAQAYSETATTLMAPKSHLSNLTVGDDLTKISMGALEADEEVASEPNALTELFSIDILQSDPSKANINTVSQFGRELAGTGLATLGGAGIAKITGWGETSNVLSIIGGLMLIAGALVGYVMPIVFAIYGIMGVISWLTFVASAFFGVTLWSAAFAAPKGEEHTSQMAAKGWNILIFIGLYPALAVGGLAAAVTITSLALPLINILMTGLWGMSDNGVADLTQPFDALAGILIGSLIIVLATCALFWSTCMTSASLITNFPRTVLNMVSFAEPGLNPYENTSQGIMGNITGLIKMPMATVGRNVVSKLMAPSTPDPRNRAGA